MNFYESKKRWGLITTIIMIFPLPFIGYLLKIYFNLTHNTLFYTGLPFYMLLITGFYYTSIIALAVLIYKLHKPLKEGLFSVNSSEMSTWLSAQFVMQLMEILKNFQVPSSILRRFYSNVFSRKIGKIMIMSGTIEHSLVDIGSNAIIGHSAEIWGHMIEGDKIYIRKVKIGSNCTIGTKSVVMPGAEIGNNTIVGACSLVPKNAKLDSNAVYVGVPVKRIR